MGLTFVPVLVALLCSSSYVMAGRIGCRVISKEIVNFASRIDQRNPLLQGKRGDCIKDQSPFCSSYRNLLPNAVCASNRAVKTNQANNCQVPTGTRACALVSFGAPGTSITELCPSTYVDVYVSVAGIACGCPDGQPAQVGYLVQTTQPADICRNPGQTLVDFVKDLFGRCEIYYMCYVCPREDPNGPGGGGDPHFHGFDGTEFDVKGRDGLYYNIFSENNHVVNARFANVKPVLVENLWMTEIGFVYDNTTVTVKLDLDAYQAQLVEAFDAEDRVGRMLYEDLRKLVVVEVNGVEERSKLKSDESLQPAEGINVYFPAANHSNDPTDGPLIVVTTSLFEVSILLETEGVVHLDTGFVVVRPTGLPKHGILGQTLQWDVTEGNNHLEGEEDDYIVRSLLATNYKFSQFGKTAKPVEDTNGFASRKLLSLDSYSQGRFGGSVPYLY